MEEMLGMRKIEYWCCQHNKIPECLKPGHNLGLRPCRKEACERWSTDRAQLCIHMSCTQNGKPLLP